MKKIVLAGGTGFLGGALKAHFLKMNYEVIVLSRGKNSKSDVVYWDGETIGDWATCLEDVDTLINLSGKSVNCRYNSKNQKLILESRIKSTAVLGEAILKLKNPPKLWINSSSATIYPNSLDECKTEKHDLGTGFSVEVCKAWEKTFYSFDTPNTRKVAIRSSMVFGRHGSVYKTLKSLSLKGLGGTQGSGEQFISWIHLCDFINAICFISDNKSLEGNVNVCSPNPKPNKEFNKLLRKSLGVQFHFPVKTWMIYLGAVFMGTEAELVLKSRKVIPEKLIQSGFEFEYPRIEMALQELNR